jgi:hypothetical protein
MNGEYYHTYLLSAGQKNVDGNADVPDTRTSTESPDVGFSDREIINERFPPLQINRVNRQLPHDI